MGMVGFDRERTHPEVPGEGPEEKLQREQARATEREPFNESKPLPEGEGIWGIQAYHKDKQKFTGGAYHTPEFIFGRMGALNPYYILSWIPFTTFDLEKSVLPEESALADKPRTRVPSEYPFRGVRYHLTHVAMGGMGDVYRGVAASEDLRKHPTHPRTIIFKSVPRSAHRDPSTLQEIALMAALHPDPQAPKDSLPHAVRWAGRSEEEAEEMLTWGEPDGPQEKEESEALPVLYEAMQYRIGDWGGFGIVMEDLGEDTYKECMEAFLPKPNHIPELRSDADRREVLKHLDSLVDALDELASLADGVAQLHAKGIVYRDLKPENLFLRDDGRIALADLGIGYHPYYRGREYLPRVFKDGYDVMRAYGAALYGLLQERGIGFGIIDPEADERTAKKAEVRQEGKHLSLKDEIDLWETMHLITSAVYTAEVSDQERLKLLQHAFLSAENSYKRMAMRYRLPEVQPLSREEQRKFLTAKLSSSKMAVNAMPREELEDFSGKSVEALDPVYQGKRKKMPAVGTPHYMAPEQAQGKGLSTRERHKMDVFALGVIAMERLKLGKVPKRRVPVPQVREDDPNRKQVMDAYRQEAIQAGRELMDARISESRGIVWEPLEESEDRQDPIFLQLRAFLDNSLLAIDPGERVAAFEAAREFKAFADHYRQTADAERAWQTADKEAGGSASLTAGRRAG